MSTLENVPLVVKTSIEGCLLNRDVQFALCLVPCALCRSKARAVASGGDQLEANIQRAVKEVGEFAVFLQVLEKRTCK